MSTTRPIGKATPYGVTHGSSSSRPKGGAGGVDRDELAAIRGGRKPYTPPSNPKRRTEGQPPLRKPY